MHQVTLDPATLAKFDDSPGLLEVRDQAGRLRGYFSPIRPLPLEEYANAEVPFSTEEIRELRRQPGGRPLADILRDLERGQ